MIGQPRRQGWGPVSPAATMSSRPTEPEAQGTMGAHESVNRILEVDVVLQVVLSPGVRQCLAHQPPVALAGGQVVALHVRGVDLGATAIHLQDPDEIVLGAEENLPLDFDHAASFASLSTTLSLIWAARVVCIVYVRCVSCKVPRRSGSH